MPRSTAWSRGSWALVWALLAVNVYRAATQSITTDEAFTFNAYVDAPIGDAVRHYDANNHVLYSAMERASVALFGVSELAVRLPSLLGGALYLWSALQLCLYVFRPGWMAFLCLAAVSGNPFVLDYLSIARGYGMGLGLLSLALYLLVWHTAEDRRGAPFAAGLSLGLSIAANLIFLVPAAAIGALFAFVMVRARRTGFWELVDRFALPAVLAAFLPSALPLSHASGGNYYYGARRLSDTAIGLAQVLFVPALEGRSRFGIELLPFERLWVAAPVAALLVLLAGLGAARAIGKRALVDARDACAALAGGAVVISLAVLVAAHWLRGIPYPHQRTGLYFVPLLTWALLAAARRPLVRAAAGVLTAVCVLQFALLFRVDHYGNWVDDAAMKRVLLQLRAREDGLHPVRVAASASSNQTVRFYRRRYRWNWMEAFWFGEPGSNPDYYVLWKADESAVEKQHLTVLYRDPLNGMLLAR